MSANLTLNEVAALLRVAPRRVRELCSRSALSHIRLGRRDWLFSQQDIDRFLASHRFEARTAFPAKKGAK
jgi:excisionase family DNA binding protein